MPESSENGGYLSFEGGLGARFDRVWQRWTDPMSRRSPFEARRIP